MMCRGRWTALLCSAGVLLLLAGPAQAATDITAPITDKDGRTWVPLTGEQYRASAQVADFDRVFASVTDGDFRATSDSYQEGDTYRETIVYRNGVTRSASKDYQGDREVVYVEGRRQCSRPAASAKQAALARDRSAEFTCGRVKKYSVRGDELVEGLQPSAAAGLGDDLVYLVLDDDRPLAGDALARMDVLVMVANDLRNYGIDAVFPRVRYSYVVRPDEVETSSDQFNGYDSISGRVTVNSTDVPRLPRIRGL